MSYRYNNPNPNLSSKYSSTSRLEEDVNNRSQFRKNNNLIGSQGNVKNDFNFNNTFQVIPEQEASTFDKVTFLKKQFDARVKNLYSELKTVVNNLENDELLQTMKKDATTSEFYSQRLKEIIDDSLHLEKELVIKNLTEEVAEVREQNANLNSQNLELIERIKAISDNYEANQNELIQGKNKLVNSYNQLQNDMKELGSTYDKELNRILEECKQRLGKQGEEVLKLKEDNTTLNERLDFYESKLKEYIHFSEESKIELERLNKIINVYELDLSNADSTLRDKQSKIEAFQQELGTLQAKEMENTLKLKKVTEENKSLNSIIEHYESERKELLNKYNNFTEEVHKSQNEKIEELDRQYKEKNTQLKKKIMELKEVINGLEERNKEERTVTMSDKENYSKLIGTMQEDLLRVKNEWEKKVLLQRGEHEEELEGMRKSYENEIIAINKTHEIQVESLNRDLQRYKQDSNLLKTFEKEYIKLNKHEEILEEELCKLRQVNLIELKKKGDEVENEVKARLFKIDEDKKKEYDFLSEGLKKNISNLEQSNNELKRANLDYESKLRQVKEANELLKERIEGDQKSIRALNDKLEEKRKEINQIMEKCEGLEGDYRLSFNSNKNSQTILENLAKKIETLEKEKNQSRQELKDKEEYYKVELDKLDQSFRNFQKLEEAKLNNEKESHYKTKAKAEEYESMCSGLEDEVKFINKKNLDLANNVEYLEELLENYSNKNKALDLEKATLEKKCLSLEKKLQRFSINSDSNKSLVIRLLTTKCQHLKNELEKLKSFAKNEIAFSKKEASSFVEIMSSKIKAYCVHTEKDFDSNLRNMRDHCEREIKRKVDEQRKENGDELRDLREKYEKQLQEEQKSREKVEKEKNQALENVGSLSLKINELNYKTKEGAQDNASLLSQINKLKQENEYLVETMDKIRQERHNLTLQKLETEENVELSKRELAKHYQASLSNLQSNINEIKNKYQKEINRLKGEVESLNNYFENELDLNRQHYERIIEKLENGLRMEKSELQRLKPEIENREYENQIFKKDLERLRVAYDSKITTLNEKANEDRVKIQELKKELKEKNEQGKDQGFHVNELKANIKSLKSQVELKGEEIVSLKKEYEKNLNAKEKKIADMQSVLNQTYLSYNTGVNNIKLSNKINEEINLMMKRMKVEDIDEEGGKKGGVQSMYKTDRENENRELSRVEAKESSKKPTQR